MNCMPPASFSTFASGATSLRKRLSGCVAAGFVVATMIPLAYIVRAVMYRAGREADGSVRPGSYGTGNIVFLAMCEGSAFFSLICGMLNGGTGLPMLLAVIPLVVQLINFPTGRP